MAACFGTVTAIGSESAAIRGSFCTKNNRSLHTSNSTKTTRITTRTSSLFSNPNLSGAPFHLLRIRASSGPNPTDDPKSSILQDDSMYLLQLGVGSVLGAAVIKYGSIVIPDITRPNLIQALLMILTPVFIAVLLLIKESRKE